MTPIHAKLEVVVHKAEEGGYWAEVPALPGCFSQAETLAELRRNIQEAVDLYLDVATPQKGGATGRGRVHGASSTTRAKGTPEATTQRGGVASEHRGPRKTP
jgi:predicted RNase H-like HicB family nuclease